MSNISNVNNLAKFVTLGIEHLWPEFDKIARVQLSQQQKFEIIRQIFDKFECDFRTVSLKFQNFINYDLVFPHSVNESTKQEINQIVYVIAMGIFFECSQHGLFIENHNEIKYFPYFLENINQSTCLLRADEPFVGNPTVYI